MVTDSQTKNHDASFSGGVLVIVPTYNEVENVAALLEAIERHLPSGHILVVDDNSPDGTQRVVKQFQLRSPNIHLLSRLKKEGLSLAYAAGFAWGMERGFDFIIQMDADFSHDPKTLPRIVEHLKSSAVVTGSRYIPGGSVAGWSWVRQLISRGGNIYARRLLGMAGRDLTGGFNGWRTAVLRDINATDLKSRGYAFQVELKYRAFRKGYRITEIPIHFENRRLGKSKMSGDIVWEAALRLLEIRSA